MLKKAGVRLLLEKVGVPLCFPVIKRPCFERQIRKTRHYTNVVGWSVKILHSELFPGSSAVLCCSLIGFCTGRYSKWSWSGVSSFLLQVSLFLRLKRIILALRHLRRAGVALLAIPWSLKQGECKKAT